MDDNERARALKQAAVYLHYCCGYSFRNIEEILALPARSGMNAYDLVKEPKKKKTDPPEGNTPNPAQ